MSQRLISLIFALVFLSGSTSVQQARPSSNANGDTADQAFALAMRDMMAATNANAPTGETDQDFVRLMVPYHQAAIAMAKAELRYGHDENLKSLASDIVTMQEKEIALMKAWEDRRRGGH